MVDVAVEEHQIAQFEIGLVIYPPTQAELLGRGVGQAHPDRSPGLHREARVVPRARPGVTARVELPELRFRER
jgi:hypothetical protein